MSRQRQEVTPEQMALMFGRHWQELVRNGTCSRLKRAEDILIEIVLGWVGEHYEVREREGPFFVGGGEERDAL